MAAAAHPSLRWHCFIFHSCFDGNLSTLHGIYAICAIFSTFQWSYLSLNDKWELDGRSRAHKPFFYGILYCFYDGIIFTVRLSCVTCCLFFCLSCTHSSNPFAQHPKVFHFSTEWWALLRRNVEHWMKFDLISSTTTVLDIWWTSYFWWLPPIADMTVVVLVMGEFKMDWFMIRLYSSIITVRSWHISVYFGSCNVKIYISRVSHVEGARQRNHCPLGYLLCFLPPGCIFILINSILLLFACRLFSLLSSPSFFGHHCQLILLLYCSRRVLQ